MSKDYNEIWLESMSLLIDHRLQGLNFDKTVKCQIVTDKGNGTYLVQENDTVKYEAISAGINYKVDEWVYVTIPNGNYNSTKIIISKYTENPVSNPVNYISPLGTFVPMTENLAADLEGVNSTFGLLTNGSDLPENLKQAGESLILERIAEFDLANHADEEIRYNEIYDTIGLSADFKTLLSGYDIVGGSYGLRLFFIEEGKNPTIADFDCSEMFGDPYAYNLYLTQSKKFDISSLGNISKIILILYQKDNFKCYNEEGEIVKVSPTYTMLDQVLRKPDNILVQNIQIYLGKDIITIEDNTFELSVPGGESTKMQYDKNSLNEDINTKTIYATWYNKTDDNEFIGFSDGVVDKEYDEDEYLNEYETQMAGAVLGAVDGVPRLKESLQIYANAQNIDKEFKTIYSRTGQDIQTALTNLYVFIKNNNLIEDADENGVKIIDKFNPIIVFDKDNQIGKEGLWQEFLNQYARLDYDGADEENEKSFFDIYLSYLTQSDDYIKFLLDTSTEEKPTIPKWNTKTIEDRYNASSRKWGELKTLINSLYFFIKDTTIEKNYHGDIRAYVDRNAQQMNQYINYIDQAYNAISALMAQSETQISSFQLRLVNKNLTTFEEEYELFQRKNANKYCIYWYRKCATGLGDRWVPAGWERINFNPISSTPGMPDIEVDKYTKRSKLSYQVHMNHDVATDNFKAVLFFNHIPYWSNELEFVNLTPPIDTSGADLTGALYIELSHNASASYQKYGSSLSLLNMSDAMINRETIIRYKNIDATEGDEVLVGCWIYWYMPLNATMLAADESRLIREGFSILSGYSDNLEFKDDYDKYYKEGYECYFKQIRSAENGEDKIAPHHDDVTFYHLIKPVYNPSYTQNEILCVVNKGGVDYSTSYLFTFSTFGTSGTDFTLSIAPTTTQYAVEYIDDKKNRWLPLRASFSGYDGSPVENPPAITTSWWGNKINDGIRQLGTNVQGSIDYEVCFNTSLDYTTNCLYKVLECQADWNRLTQDVNADQTITLKSYYPVATSLGMYYMTGPTTIVYDDAGNNPIYSNEAYKLFYRGRNDEIENLTWKLIHYYYNEDKEMDLVSEDNTSLLRYLPTIGRYEEEVNGKKIYRYKLKPLTMYVADINVYTVAIALNEENKCIFAQPIFISQNRYGSPMVNTWDEKLQIDEKNNTILTSMIGAGYKDDENRFYGVFMGNVGEKTENNTMGVGIYGVNEGYQSFGLTVDGKAFLGKAGRGQIKIDGNKSTIQSASYELNNGDSGMLIDLDDGIIDMKGTTEYIEDDFATLEDKRGCASYKDYKARFGPLYKKDTTLSHIQLNVKSPYFQITSAANHNIIHIADNEYYLKSDNYKPGEYNWTDREEHSEEGAGTKFDLQTGLLDAYNLKIQSKNILLDSSIDANPYFIIKDNDGCNIFYSGTDSYYLQTHGYTKRNEDEEGNTTTYGKGMKIDLQGNHIDAYDFYIRGEKSDIKSPTVGSYMVLSSNPILKIHLINKDTSQNLDLLSISDTEFIMHSIDWSSSTETTTETKTVGTVVNVNSYLNVRSGPSTGYSIVGSLTSGQVVTVYESSGGWHRIGNGQWVSGDYLSVSTQTTTTTTGISKGAEIDMNTGKITFHNDSNTILIDSRSNYPLQIGLTNKANLKFGWNGDIYGGSTYPWSISADGVAVFKSLNAYGGSFSGILVSNATISNATINNATISGGSIGSMNVSGLTVTDRFTMSDGKTYGPQDFSLSYTRMVSAIDSKYVLGKNTPISIVKSSHTYSTSGMYSSGTWTTLSTSTDDGHSHTLPRHYHQITVKASDLVGDITVGDTDLILLVNKTTTGLILANADIETIWD